MSFDPIVPSETDHSGVGVIALSSVDTGTTVDTIVIEPPSGGGGGGGGDWGGGYDPGGGEYGGGGGGGGGNPPDISAIDPIKIVEALKAIPWGQAGITANELALKVTNGYNGEKIDTNTLSAIASANGVAIYGSPTGAMYGDRDGNGQIDTGILYNPSTGLISADFGCDGVGDQVIAHV